MKTLLSSRALSTIFIVTLLAIIIYTHAYSVSNAQNQNQQTPQNPNNQNQQGQGTSRTTPTLTQTPSTNTNNGVGIGSTRAVSNTCTTKIGEPTGTTQPGCDTSGSGSGGGTNPGMGQFSFPLNTNTVTAVATEMAAYPNNGNFDGHREHAGLDIGTPEGTHAPVYAVANGTVIGRRESCDGRDYTCRLDITHSGDNFISSYSHIDASVGNGATVTKGQQIGVVHYWGEGQNMDHLHFELLDQNRKSSLGVGWNINPRNYFPELQRWVPFGYGGTGQAVRSYTAAAGYPWVNDGKEFGETFLNHPPCPGTDCWAH